MVVRRDVFGASVFIGWFARDCRALLAMTLSGGGGGFGGSGCAMGDEIPDRGFARARVPLASKPHVWNDKRELFWLRFFVGGL